ncbi:MAG: hypothetical protein Q8K58_08730 [Acidimicrobiales bacterium]|nr:hypothetical protein [Acidimicrobiales bacterium]
MWASLAWLAFLSDPGAEGGTGNAANEADFVGLMAVALAVAFAVGYLWHRRSGD